MMDCHSTKINIQDYFYIAWALKLNSLPSKKFSDIGKK